MTVKSHPDLVVYSLHVAGGGTRSLHTEEIARVCWQIFPDEFSWSRYPQYPDKESVNTALRGASTVGQDERVANPEPDMWRLTSLGIAWAAEHAVTLDNERLARAENVERQRQRRQYTIGILLGLVASLGVCFGIAHGDIVVGSLDGHWVYPYVRAFELSGLGVPLAAGVVASVLVALQEPLIPRRTAFLVIAWLGVATTVQWALRSLTPVTFASIFVSDQANAFYSVAKHYPAAVILRDFEQLRPSFPLHAWSNMPGKLLLVSALKHVSRRPDRLAWLVVAISNLGGVLMYVFVNDLVRDRRVALFAQVLYLFTPGALYFFPLLNTVTPVLTLAFACLSSRWLRTQRPIYPALLGITLYGLILYEPLALGIGLLTTALAARALARGDITRRTFLVQCGVGAGAFLAVYVLMAGVWHFDLFAALRAIEADAERFNAGTDRPYSIWVWRNLVDFAFAMGIAQAVIFCVVFWVSLARRAPWRARLLDPITATCAALAGTLLVTDLIGVNRGEVIRLWIFLACFFQIPTAFACARSGRTTALALVVASSIVQSALGTAMIGFVIP